MCTTPKPKPSPASPKPPEHKRPSQIPSAAHARFARAQLTDEHPPRRVPLLYFLATSPAGAGPPGSISASLVSSNLEFPFSNFQFHFSIFRDVILPCHAAEAQTNREILQGHPRAHPLASQLGHYPHPVRCL